MMPRRQKLVGKFEHALNNLIDGAAINRPVEQSLNTRKLEILST